MSVERVLMNLQAANSICSGWLMSSKMPEDLHLGLPKIQVILFFRSAIILQNLLMLIHPITSRIISWMSSGAFIGYYTVTRLDVIFHYPDRVPLTHFVHRAKKAFAMRAWIFCWVLCATAIFQRCNGKVIEHRVGANLWPSDYGPSVLPLRNCSHVWKTQGHSSSSFAGIFRPFL